MRDFRQALPPYLATKPDPDVDYRCLRIITNLDFEADFAFFACGTTLDLAPFLPLDEVLGLETEGFFVTPLGLTTAFDDLEGSLDFEVTFPFRTPLNEILRFEMCGFFGALLDFPPPFPFEANDNDLEETLLLGTAPVFEGPATLVVTCDRVFAKAFGFLVICLDILPPGFPLGLAVVEDFFNSGDRLLEPDVETRDFDLASDL